MLTFEHLAGGKEKILTLWFFDEMSFNLDVLSANSFSTLWSYYPKFTILGIRIQNKG